MMGEGAGILVLEKEDLLWQEAPRSIASLLAMAMEAMEMQSRLRWKMTRCVKMNLPGARWYKIQKDETSIFLMLQVWSVNGHATSTTLEDRAECTALRQVAVANTFQN